MRVVLVVVLLVACACGGKVDNSPDGISPMHRPSFDAGTADSELSHDSEQQSDQHLDQHQVLKDAAPQDVSDQTVLDQTFSDLLSTLDQGALDTTIPQDSLPNKDQLLPDQGLPDQGLPDQSLPDQSLPDQSLPDQSLPDQSLPDQGPADAFIPPCRHPVVNKNCEDGWCVIPAGCFKMMAQGSGFPSCDKKKWREVRITHSFLMSQKEVTCRAFWDLLNDGCFGASGFWKGLPGPAAKVPVAAAENYCNELSRHEQLEQCYQCSSGSHCGAVCVPVKDPYKCKGYRLPTEAEWEYAYRAGSSTDYYNGDIAKCTTSTYASRGLEEIAWYNNKEPAAHVGCKLEQNGWGLCDMSGNVREWAYDNYVPPQGTVPLVDPVGRFDNMRVFRGGHYNDFAWRVMGSSRAEVDPSSTALFYDGFRCVRTL